MRHDKSNESFSDFSKSLVKSIGSQFFALLPAIITTFFAASLLTSCSHHTQLPKSERHVTGVIKGHNDSDTREMKIWFVKPAHDEVSLVPVIRTLTHSDQLAEAVEQLLSGPTATEKDSGLSSEIPKGTTLLGVKRTDGEVELNLSKDFASSGGGTSLETRIEQLSRTVSDLAGSQKVYLAIEGERVSAAEFDGLEIKQPINN
ncbi:MAG: GerMN domain-containing protein [Candidatus Obscuribacterales bacterium]|nr:GerMN domain-containing protein [Cyanobacteria bacterium SZAS LIN-5]